MRWRLDTKPCDNYISACIRDSINLNNINNYNSLTIMQSVFNTKCLIFTSTGVLQSECTQIQPEYEARRSCWIQESRCQSKPQWKSSTSPLFAPLPSSWWISACPPAGTTLCGSTSGGNYPVMTQQLSRGI